MSQYYTLMNGIKNQLDALALGVPTSIRSNVFLLEGENSVIIISAGDDHEDIRWQTMNTKVVYNYPIYVVLVQPNNRQIDQTYAHYLDLREAIRNELFSINEPGFTITFDTLLETSVPTSQFGALKNTNYAVTGYTLIYSCTVNRNHNPS